MARTRGTLFFFFFFRGKELNKDQRQHEQTEATPGGHPLRKAPENRRGQEGNQPGSAGDNCQGTQPRQAQPPRPEPGTLATAPTLPPQGQASPACTLEPYLLANAAAKKHAQAHRHTLLQPAPRTTPPAKPSNSTDSLSPGPGLPGLHSGALPTRKLKRKKHAQAHRRKLLQPAPQPTPPARPSRQQAHKTKQPHQPAKPSPSLPSWPSTPAPGQAQAPGCPG
jgi:hypothetical protein